MPFPKIDFYIVNYNFAIIFLFNDLIIISLDINVLYFISSKRLLILFYIVKSRKWNNTHSPANINWYISARGFVKKHENEKHQ